MLKQYIKIINILFLISMVGCLYFGIVIFKENNFKDKVVFLDVGQGDSELIITKHGKVLIDGGPSKKVIYSLANVLPAFDRTIDVLILTHSDNDHLNGFNYVLDYYDVKVVMLSDFSCVKTSCVKFYKKLEELNIPIILGVSGSRIVLGDSEIDFLYPKESDLKNINSTNDYSIVNLLKTKEGNILFTGDLKKNILEDVVGRYDFSGVDILKVPHHGAKNGLNDFILEKVNPRDVVIEVGQNSYGHPSVNIIELIQSFNIGLFRTDLLGSVEFVKDKGDWLLK
jgi:competence protein ComEC